MFRCDMNYVVRSFYLNTRLVYRSNDRHETPISSSHLCLEHPSTEILLGVFHDYYLSIRFDRHRPCRQFFRDGSDPFLGDGN